MKFSEATGADSVYRSMTISPNSVVIVAVVPSLSGSANGLAIGVAAGGATANEGRAVGAGVAPPGPKPGMRPRKYAATPASKRTTTAAEAINPQFGPLFVG